ncbi:transcription-repair coupling factor [bacterium]|nr:transcription-repair coupling factor [bacterium]
MKLDKAFNMDRGSLRSVKEAVDRGKKTVVFYAAEYNRLHIASAIKHPFLYVVSDLIAARKAVDCLSEYCQESVELLPEKEDVLISRQGTNYNLLNERIRILAKLISGEIFGVVATADALTQYYPKSSILKDSIITINVGDSFDTDILAEKLVSTGYRRKSAVEAHGEFLLRGDVLDIFPIGEESPIRINFFGDTVESIHRFCVDTMLSGGKLKELTIYPSTDILVPSSEVEGILNKVKRVKKNSFIALDERINAESERFLLNPSNPLNTFFIPFIKPYLGTIYDYLPDNAVIIFDDTKQIEDKLRVNYNRFVQRVKSMRESDLCLKEHSEAILSMEEVKDFCHTALGFGRITSQIGLFVPEEVFSIKTQALPAFYNNMPDFFEQMKAFNRNGATVRIYVKDEISLSAVAETLRREFIGVETEVYDDTPLGILIGKVSHGFIYPNEKLVLIGVNDLTRKVDRSKSLARKKIIFELPEKGDFVVHEKHGIGISEGMQRIATSSGVKDFYVIAYRDGDKLYLPADQLNTVEKYNGATAPSLHRLGGAEFERVKNRVKASIKTMAIDLLSLYQSRYQKKGYKYQADTVWQKEMEDDFEYTETDDQLIAISEIKQDMESGKIMDRLLCGDVGYGKTEVALRAIFKTVIEGKQAAILAPTTILAQQHYNLLCARMNKFKLKIDLLSRFVSNKDIKESLERIKKGESNIIVATHRILSKDVEFFDLGLLILDEEQRFGVEHKEKLKLFRNKVNILSLSATPIPRTLHMALSGIRDISTLEMPPKNRLPVETYVTEYNENLLKDAVNRELNRNGQVFILYNRVQSIEKFYNKVCSLFDENVNIIYAHGQMEETLLEDRIKEFYDNKAQVLISTTIIENGIDLPNANTLFVINADMLGLSQLYQLRGRVGRSEVPAYAYFTVPEGKVLTSNAVSRLEALMDNTELGSGFKIAMRDLEIRGAGNLLGREQHGQMEKVGYEMYLKLVKEGIDEIQGKAIIEEREIEMKVDGDYALDENYISDSKERVNFYRRISCLTSREEGQEYFDSLKQTYGKPPSGINNIIRLGIIKNLAQKHAISKVSITKNGTGLFFYDTKCLTNEKLFAAISSLGKNCVLSMTEPPAVIFNDKKLGLSDKIKLVLNFLLSI